MKRDNLLPFATVLVVGLLVPANARAQLVLPAADTDQLTTEARNELAQRLDRDDAIRDNSSSNADGASFVESATAVRGWSLAINGSSTFDSFRFPITLSSSLAQLAHPLRNPAFTTNRLLNSQLSATYTPLEVGTEEVDRPGGSDTQLKTEAGKKVVANYKISLTRIHDISELDARVSAEIANAFSQVAPRFQDPNNPNLPNLFVNQAQLLQEVQALVQSKIDAIVTSFKRDLDRRWKWSAKADYTRITEGDQPDQYGISLLGGREGLGSAEHPIGIGTTLAWSRSRENALVDTSEAVSLGGALGIGLREGIKLKIEAQGNRYMGDGFAGIPGVLDSTADSEVNLAESLVFKIAGGQKLALTLKQLHLTTGDTDFALVTGFGYSF